MSISKKRYRLAIDLGSNSIGWVLFQINENDWPIAVEKSGVRIFSNARNPKSNVPSSVERTMARGARRRRDRLLMRKRSLLKFLGSASLLPISEEDSKKFADMDPYRLRHEALNRELSAYELSRVLLHLAQRRGFLSNRKNKDKDEGGKALSAGIAKLHSDILESGAQTLGSFLFTHRTALGLPTRMRSDEEWYPNRQLYREEFNKIKEYQQSNFTFGIEGWDKLERILFTQRELKKQPPGKCLFKPSEDRGYRALPSFQRFRMHQQIANLKVMVLGSNAIDLTGEQIEKLISELQGKKELSFEKARDLLGIENGRFNLERDRNNFRAAKHLHGDRTSHLLSNKKYFGKLWSTLEEHEQNLLVKAIIDEQDQAALKSHIRAYPGLSEEQVENISQLTEDDFERGYAEFSEEVLLGISQFLKKNPGSSYDQAVASLGYHHSDFRIENLTTELPYYGEALRNSVRPVPNSKVKDERETGKIFNPTVHVALNQLRKIVNALIIKYGSFDQIIVEVARDLPLGEQGLRELAIQNRDNERRNDAWRARLAELGQSDTFNNRLRLRLWEELGEGPLARQCPYSGDVISIEKLFSPEIEIDHILPRSKTFSNHHSNLILCTRKANQYKKNRSPYEAFSSSSSPYSYEAILARVTSLPLGKQRKFSPDAMSNFEDTNAFLERQLGDTRFISKAAHRYLQHICKRVMVSKGGLTAYLRSEMNLNRLLSPSNKKNRTDHRHHAVDAFIIGLCEPKTLLTLERELKSFRFENENPLVGSLVAEFRSHVNDMIVSHKVDHRVSKKLFEETAYGKISDSDDLLTLRKSVENINDLESIVDSKIREFALRNQNLTKAELAQAIATQFGAKKLKTTKKDASKVRICHPRSNPRFEKWVIPLDINRVEFWRLPGVSSPERLVAVSYTTHEVVSLEVDAKKPHPAARKLLAIRKGDYLRLTLEGGVDRTVLVESLRPANQIVLFTDHYVGKNENAKGRSITFSGLAAKKVRVVHVDELGQIKDPGAWWLNDFKNTRNTITR